MGTPAPADNAPPASPAQGSTGPNPRPWLGIVFRCCGAYGRIYKNREGTAYTGRCPACATWVRAAVGPGGTNQRFFEAR